MLSAGVLGLVLAGPGLGALAGSQALVRRLGSRTVSALAPVVLCLPLGLVPTAHSAWSLMAVLLLLGAADGCTSVAMNAQAVSVQQQYGRAVLNSMHAIRSIGAVAGGLAGVATASLNMPLTAQFVSMAVLLAVVSAVAACGLQPDVEGVTRTPPSNQATAADGSTEPAGQGPKGRLTVPLLALMTFLAALVEDAPASWSGVYLRHVGADTAMAAAGYAAFSAGSVVTRLFNDWLVDRLGWVRLIRIGTLCCAAALTVALLLGRPGVTLAALVVAGAGISAVFPGAFTAAGALPDSARVMGHVGFAGNLGCMGGGLPTALGLLAVAAAVIAGLAPVTCSVAPVRSLAYCELLLPPSIEHGSSAVPVPGIAEVS